MATSIIKNISIRIAGTKERKAGFAPLLTVGVLPGDEGDQMDRITIVAEKPVMIIKHTREYVLYGVIDRQVKSFDADAPGVLSIAITIPSDVQLANNASPYTLVKEVYDTFVSSFMTTVSDGRSSFMNVEIDNDVFCQIVAKYPLEPRSTTYIPMNPKGLTATLCLPEEKREIFFRDSQYSQFAQFKEIEIGRDCVTTEGLGDLQIPRPVKYKVFVNNMQVNKTLSDPLESYTVMANPKKRMESTSITFSLSDLFSAGGIIKNDDGVEVKLDTTNNRVYCTLPHRDKYYELKIKIEGQDEDTIKQLIENEKIFITANGRKTTRDEDKNIAKSTLKGESLSVRGSDIDITQFSIVPSEYDSLKLSVSTSVNENSQYLILTIRSKRKPAPIKTPTDIKRPPVKGMDNIDASVYDQGDMGNHSSFEHAPKRRIHYKSISVGAIFGLIVGLALGFVLGHCVIKNKVENDDPTVIEDLVEDPETTIDTINSNKNVSVMQESPNVDNEGDLENNDAKAKAAEAEAKAKAAEAEAKAKAAAEAKAKKDKDEILDFVKAKDLSSCQKHPGYKSLSNQEKIAIEAVLNPDQYNKIINADGKKALLEIKNEIKNGAISSWNDIINFYEKIQKIVLNNPKKG